MQTRQRILSSSLAILIAIPVFTCDRASAANRWWDGGTTDIAGNGEGTSTGGTGTWNTTLLNWDAGAAPHVAWTNAGNDTAIFGGTAGTVTLGVPISLSNITFAAGSLGTSQYTLAGSTLNFTNSGLIANLNGANGRIQTISSAITGFPAVNLITSSSGGDITGGLKFAPTGGALQNLGTVTLAAGYPGSTGGADKTTLTLGGSTTGNTVHTVNQNTNFSLIRKTESGSWTVTGVAKFGRLYMNGGNLIVTGTLQGTQYQGPFLNSGILHYSSPAAVYTGTNFGNSTVFIFNGGSLDQTSGAPITTSTHDPYMDWRANVTFIGSPYQDIATTTTNSHPVSSGVIDTTYYYVVAATNSGGPSGNSNQASSLFVGDPLIVAANQIKAHINNAPALSAAQLGQASLALAAQTNRFAESATTIAAVFDLVSTYDNVKGALFVGTATGGLTRSAEINDLTWTIYRTMQGIMDKIYNAPTLAAR